MSKTIFQNSQKDPRAVGLGSFWIPREKRVYRYPQPMNNIYLFLNDFKVSWFLDGPLWMYCIEICRIRAVAKKTAKGVSSKDSPDFPNYLLLTWKYFPFIAGKTGGGGWWVATPARLVSGVVCPVSNSIFRRSPKPRRSVALEIIFIATMVPWYHFPIPALQNSWFQPKGSHSSCL